MNLVTETPIMDKNHGVAVKTIKALGHAYRRAILKIIAQQGPITVNEIVADLRCLQRNNLLGFKRLVEQSVVSHHLKWLKDAGVVSNHRSGKFIEYTTQPDHIECLDKILDIIQNGETNYQISAVPKFRNQR